MKYSKQLIITTKEYLTKKIGEEPNDDTVLQFLRQISNFGQLFVKNASKILGQN